MKYVARRAAHALLLLAAVTLLCFLMTSLVPGSYFDELALNPQIPPETVAALKSRYGAERPLLVRYTAWLSGAVRGDLGTSIVYQRPASELLLPRAGRTLALTGLAMLCTWLFAVPLGCWCAARRDGWIDRICGALSASLLAVPELLGALGLLYLTARLGWLPPAGSITLPVIVLVLGALPTVLRHSRSALIEASEAPFVRAAQVHGINGWRLWTVYIARGAANPLISLLGLSMGGLVSGSLLVESVLNWPGLGPIFLEAIPARDTDVVIGVVLMSTVFLIAGNLTADLMLYACDPRIRRSGE